MAIYRETGSAMDGMIEAPDSFRPGGGETTHELGESVHTSWRTLLLAGLTVVLTHGGHIATFAGIPQGAPAATWYPDVHRNGGVEAVSESGRAPWRERRG